MKEKKLANRNVTVTVAFIGFIVIFIGVSQISPPHNKGLTLISFICIAVGVILFLVGIFRAMLLKHKS